MKKIIISLCTCLMVLVVFPTKAIAQDYDTLHTNTWSLYLQGGMSWARGVGMKNVNASMGTCNSPLIGLGVNYNIRPWVRLGLNYELSKFAREQRFSELQQITPTTSPNLVESYAGTAYRNTLSNYHNIDLTAEFNIMEIWCNRKAKWFNLYLGTGIGGMFASGNSYDISMGYEVSNSDSGNDQKVYTWLTAGNSRHNFNALYIPVVLSAEFDVMPRLTLGVKGSGKFLFSSNSFSPCNVFAAAVVIRYNFVGAKHGYKSNKTKLDETTAKYEALRVTSDRDQDKCRMNRDAVESEIMAQKARLEALEAENTRLGQSLKDREMAELEDLSVQFKKSSSVLSAKQEGRLLRYIETAKQKNNVVYVVVGEASSEGNSEFNQSLSERRLAYVLDIMKKNGISSDKIKSTKAIGDSSQINDPIARRVTIKMER